MTFDRIADWMYERGSAKMVKRNGRDYLERFYLFDLEQVRRVGLPEPVFAHNFYMDDPDPLHDHPWDWGRVIRTGWYREDYIDGSSTICGPGHIVLRRQAEVLHRVELLTPTVSTIFWHWERRRVWGFMTADGWRPTPDQGQDGRKMKGIFLPRKIGQTPGEVKL